MIPLHNIHIKSKETLEHNTCIIFSLPYENLLLLPGGRIIFPEFQINVHPMIISSQHNKELTLKISNSMTHDINLPPGGLIPLHLISLAGRQDLKIEFNKIKAKQNKEALFITPANAKKFMTAIIIKIHLQKLRPFQSKPATEISDPPSRLLKDNILEVPTKTPDLDLLEMAENKVISATSFMLNLSTNLTPIQCLAIDQINLPENLAKKTHFPVYINKYRVIACADSGSDVTIIQLSLIKKNSTLVR